MTNRTEITKALGDLLRVHKFGGIGKYWASEVSIDPWAKKGKAKRIDFMQFEPSDQCSISSIEKGVFICYEVKSCKEDVYSGNGLNFIGEKNYIVTTMECYKKIVKDMQSGKFWKHLHEVCPESSSNVGIMVAIPFMSDVNDEFENPTPFDCESGNWKLKTIIPCRQGLRRKSMAELLFCMLRSGR